MTGSNPDRNGSALAAVLVADALDADFARLGAAAHRKAKLCLIDFLSCALEARGLEWSRQARAAIDRAEQGFGLVGGGFARAAGDAAFANAVAGHGLVREDMHAASIAHLGVVVWPALLAHAARRSLSGEAFLKAAIAGYEVGACLGRELMTADLARLYRPTGLVGAPSVALALASADGMDARLGLNAFSLAINTVAGLNQWPHTGGSEMYFHPGFAVRNGILAFDLARSGAVASSSILEGEAGLFAAYGRRSLDRPIRAFSGNSPEIMAVFNKEVPACNFAQTPCQAALLVSRHIPRHSKIENIEIFVTNAAERYPGCNVRGPFEVALQAKMSIYFGVAATLASGEIAEANYSRINDPAIASLIARSGLIVDPDLTAAFPEKQGARVRVTLSDGSAHEEALDDVVAASDGLIVDRFMESAVEAWGHAHAERVSSMIFALEECADVGEINALISATAK